MTVIDVSEQDFEAEVLERSKTTPVVVDFWAEWCGPCRQLGPTLEKAAAEREGDVVLAKLDTDANQGLAQAFRIQGIPAVKAFKDGKVVDEFVGVQPPAAVERFFDKLVPSEADALAGAADEVSLRRALELEPGRADASLALARLLVARGEDDEAVAVLDRVRGSFQASGLAAQIRLRTAEHSDLSPAWQALADGDREAAVSSLLDALEATKALVPADTAVDQRRDDLREAIVGVLDELGVEHPAAREARRRLAAALY